MLIIEDDILNSTELILAHQVNCKGVMGAGLAKTLKEKYPDNFITYRNFCVNTDFPLGECRVTKQPGRYIANLYAQDGYGRDKQQTNYVAFERALKTLKTFSERLYFTPEFQHNANYLRYDHYKHNFKISRT